MGRWGARRPYHSQSIEAFYGHVPGLKVVVPSTPPTRPGCFARRFATPTPCSTWSTRSYRAVKGDVPDGSFEVPIGRADVKREGADLTVVSYGMMLHVCPRPRLASPRRMGSRPRSSTFARSLRGSDTILDSVRTA